jgi:murein DD-endopeptidase MepM/ murein hydrolase activator NlpD
MSERRNAWMRKAAVVALSAGLLTACQTSPHSAHSGDPTFNGLKPQFPIKNPPAAQEPPAPPPVTPDAPFVRPTPNPPPETVITPSAPITSQTLPPPAASSPPEAAPPSSPPPPPPSAPPQYREVAAGAVVEADGPPRVYVVKPGDHLDAIGRELGMSRKELLDLNNLDNPNKLKPGQKLKGPATKGKAYVVGSGDTLSAIGRRFGVTSAQLADENDMKVSDGLHPGQKILLPKGYKDNGPSQVLVSPAETPPAAQPPAALPPPSVQPSTRPAPNPAPEQAPATPTPPAAPNPAVTSSGGPCISTQQLPNPLPPGFPTAAQLKALGQGKFAWPVRGGKVLACFGPQPTRAIGPDQKAGLGVINNGIDISAQPNTSVRASAAGEVIHAEQVTGSGLTVLVQHPDGWITIYGNLSSLSVPRRDVAAAPVDANGKAVARTKVKAGEEIGRSGGAADGQAMVHFEVRYSKDGASPRPIDPELILPPR